MFQDCSKTSPSNASRPLGILKCSSVIDIDNFLFNNSKINSDFLIIIGLS